MIGKCLLALCVCAAVGLCGCAQSAAVFAEADTPLSGKVIVVDPGHGGFDGGTQGKNTGVAEAQVNLAIAKKLETALKEKGAEVIMTRGDENALAHTKDEDMEARAAIIAGENVFAAVSIHQNRYSDSSVHGPQVFYYSAGTQAQSLAQCVQGEMDEALDVKRSRGAHTGDYKMLRSGKAPAIIVECGFLSNGSDEETLLDCGSQSDIAEAICRGVCGFEEKHREISC